jgi:hypothetical protein
MAQISISELSQTISELIDLDLEEQSLIVDAIDRAIDARQIVGGSSTEYEGKLGGSHPNPPILINGIVMPTSHPYPPDYFPIGKIAGPGYHPQPTPRHPHRPRHPHHPHR